MYVSDAKKQLCDQIPPFGLSGQRLIRPIRSIMAYAQIDQIARITPFLTRLQYYFLIRSRLNYFIFRLFFKDFLFLITFFHLVYLVNLVIFWLIWSDHIDQIAQKIDQIRLLNNYMEIN